MCVSTTKLIVWKVDEAKIDTDRLFGDIESVEKFANRSIFISKTLRNGSNYTSVLAVTANEGNNFTEVQCAKATTDVNDLRFDGEVAFLRILGITHSNVFSLWYLHIHLQALQIL